MSSKFSWQHPCVKFRVVLLKKLFSLESKLICQHWNRTCSFFSVFPNITFPEQLSHILLWKPQITFLFTFLPAHTTGNLLRQSDIHLTVYMASLMPVDICTFLHLFRIRHKGRCRTLTGCFIGTQKCVAHCYTICWLIYPTSVRRNIKGKQQSFPVHLRSDWRLKAWL